ncbi:MAG TPA: hypothetical protein VFN30_02835 [Chitinophagaceae bacterium]|nr:hypothetical protein [Chitinophagaceae bacterium]
MLALEINNNILPVVYNDASHHLGLTSPVYGVDLPVSKKNTAKKKRALKRRLEFSSMGLVIPFQPSLRDDKKIEEVWNDSLKRVNQQMKDIYCEECINKLLIRLRNLYNQLNMNTHRKSLAIVITPENEKLIYLNFPVRPVVFFSKSISVLELASNIQQEIDFYYLVLDKANASLYEFSNNRLGQVYETFNNETVNVLYNNVIRIINLLNGKNEKPVFVTGCPNLVELFCTKVWFAKTFHPLLWDAAPNDKEIIQSLIKEITSNWGYWRSTFLQSKVLIAQQAGNIISNAECVLRALQKGADGVLLLDKKLKKQLQKPVSVNGIFYIAEDLIHQIERFLMRGNQIEFTETGLLKGLGGIALLHKSYSHATGIQMRNELADNNSSGEFF